MTLRRKMVVLGTAACLGLGFAGSCRLVKRKASRDRVACGIARPRHRVRRAVLGVRACERCGACALTCVGECGASVEQTGTPFRLFLPT